MLVCVSCILNFTWVLLNCQARLLRWKVNLPPGFFPCYDSGSWLQSNTVWMERRVQIGRCLILWIQPTVETTCDSPAETAAKQARSAHTFEGRRLWQHLVWWIHWFLLNCGLLFNQNSLHRTEKHPALSLYTAHRLCELWFRSLSLQSTNVCTSLSLYIYLFENLDSIFIIQINK